MPSRRLFVVTVLSVLLAVGVAGFAQQPARRWVTAWATSQQGLAQDGVTDATVRLIARVTAGGDSRLLGDRRGQPWMVGVQNPRDKDQVVVTLPLENEAISTSGDYERFFEEDGERYHHIIEPSTGQPAAEVRSTTIIGPDAVLTDALSTSVFVMGVDQGLRLIATLPDYEGIVIDAEGQMFYSDGLRPPE